MRAATLNHEIFNHTVEVQTVVVTGLDQFHEVGDGVRSTAVEEVDGDVAGAGFHENLHAMTMARRFMRVCFGWHKHILIAGGLNLRT